MDCRGIRIHNRHFGLRGTHFQYGPVGTGRATYRSGRCAQPIRKFQRSALDRFRTGIRRCRSRIFPRLARSQHSCDRRLKGRVTFFGIWKFVFWNFSRSELMFNKDRWKEIMEVLTSNWFRTVLTAFGVFWGIFILLILLAAGKGMQNGIMTDFGDVATNTMFIWTQATSKDYEGLPKGRQFEFKLEDVETLNSAMPNLRYVSPRNRLGGFGGGSNVVRGIKTGAYNVFGDYPQIIKQDPLGITSGRFINQSDIEQKRKVAIIGNGVKKELYDRGEDPIGTYKRLDGNNGEQGQKQIFVPFTTFSQAFNRANNVGWMAITADDGSSITDLKETVVSILKKNRKVHPDDNRAIGYFDLYEPVSYTHLRAHETDSYLVCRLLLEKKNKRNINKETDNSIHIARQNNRSHKKNT